MSLEIPSESRGCVTLHQPHSTEVFHRLAYIITYYILFFFISIVLFPSV